MAIRRKFIYITNVDTKLHFPHFAQLVIISHNYVKGERVCYFLVTFKDLSQKEDDLVSVKIKILNLRNALWWTSKKFWCNNLFATVTTTFNMFPNIFLQTTLLCMVITTKNGAKGFQLFFVYFSFDSTHISVNENGFCSCLTKSWIGLLFLSTLAYWAYLAKTWRHLLDTIYQEQIDSYLAH